MMAFRQHLLILNDAGSIAAGVQAGIGDVAAGSLFAGLQSIGMGAAAPLFPFIVVGGLCAVGAWGAYKVLHG
jgi:hypothetical protein